MMRHRRGLRSAILLRGFFPSSEVTSMVGVRFSLGNPRNPPSSLLLLLAVALAGNTIRNVGAAFFDNVRGQCLWHHVPQEPSFLAAGTEGSNGMQLSERVKSKGQNVVNTRRPGKTVNSFTYTQIQTDKGTLVALQLHSSDSTVRRDVLLP